MTDQKILYLAVTNSLTFDQRMSRICGSLHQAGYQVHLIGIKRADPLPIRPYHQIRLTSWFRKGKGFYIENHIRLLFRKADLLVANDLDTALPIWALSKLRGIPRVMDAHEFYTEMKEVMSRPAIHRIWSSVARFVIPRFPVGTTVGSQLVEKFKREYGVHYEVIRNMPKLRPWKDPEPPSKPFLLYQGAVNHGRGFETLIPAMHQIPYPLVICGDGNFMAELRQLIDRERLWDRIQLTGMLEPEALRSWTDSASIGIFLPDPTGANQYLSLQNKFFDFIESGVPQITCRYPEYEAINQKYPVAILLDPITPTIVADAVNALMADPAKRENMRAACRSAREVYCWDQEEKELIRFYKRVFTP